MKSEGDKKKHIFLPFLIKFDIIGRFWMWIRQVIYVNKACSALVTIELLTSNQMLIIMNMCKSMSSPIPLHCNRLAFSKRVEYLSQCARTHKYVLSGHWNNALENFVLSYSQTSATVYLHMEKNSLLSFYSVLLSKLIDKITIDDLLLELTFNSKVLIEMLLKNNLQWNFTLHLWSFLSCVPYYWCLVNCLPLSTCSLGHINPRHYPPKPVEYSLFRLPVLVCWISSIWGDQ